MKLLIVGQIIFIMTYMNIERQMAQLIRVSEMQLFLSDIIVGVL